MAMGLDGKIIDPFNGLQDLKLKRIQTVRYAQDRFSEDALRMLRAIRFSSQLNFSIDDEVITAIKENRTLLEAISVERITVELTKMFGGMGVGKALDYLNETSLYQQLPIFGMNENVFHWYMNNFQNQLPMQLFWSLTFTIWTRRYQFQHG